MLVQMCVTSSIKISDKGSGLYRLPVPMQPRNLRWAEACGLQDVAAMVDRIVDHSEVVNSKTPTTDRG